MSQRANFRGAARPGLDRGGCGGGPIPPGRGQGNGLGGNRDGNRGGGCGGGGGGGGHGPPLSPEWTFPRNQIASNDAQFMGGIDTFVATQGVQNVGSGPTEYKHINGLRETFSALVQPPPTVATNHFKIANKPNDIYV